MFLINTLRSSIKVALLGGASPETKGTVKRTDQFTQFALLVIPPQLINQIKDGASTNEDIIAKDIDLGWEKVGDGSGNICWVESNVKEMVVKVSDKFSFIILKEDDSYALYPASLTLIGKFFASKIIYPLRDKIEFAETNEQAATIFKEVKLSEALPDSYHTWTDMLTDENFSRIFFNGMGVVLLDGAEEENVELGPYLVDMPLQNFETRQGFRPYGARIHFDDDQSVTAIFDYHKKKLYRRGDDGWARAKFVAKSSMITLVTAREHLVYSHLLLSNSTTRHSTVILSPSHPIRRLLTIFIHRTNTVNFNAVNTLVPENSLLHRGTGFEYKALVEVFESSFESCNIFQPFPTRKIHPSLISLSQEGKLPYISEGIEYYDIVKNFVKRWLDEAGEAANDDKAKAFYEAMQEDTKGQSYELPDFESEDSMVNLISQIIFVVTAWHELVGGVVDYVSLPSQCGFRIAEDESHIDVDLQSYFLMGLVGASTSIRMPFLMRSFKNFFGKGVGQEWEVTVWGDFLAALVKQSVAVKVADAKRSVEFKTFDPENFECSVSV